jgi:8-oxo-dGTP pyrophosphatase MutT (NUDIX family)
MSARNVTYVGKACIYITRGESELLVFEGPEHDGLQIPKGTIEPGETPRAAAYREAVEESGLATFEGFQHLTTDVWTRRESPPKRYVRSFFHAPVHEPRDAWTHTVTGEGEERGLEFEFSWVDLPTDAAFALDLDDYLHALPGVVDERTAPGVAAD